MNKKKILLIIFCVFLPILLLLFSYKITLAFSLVTPEQQETIDFLKEKGELNLNFTPNEESHLEDVKSVMKKMNNLFYLSLLICSLLLTYHKKDIKKFRTMLYCGSITSLVIMGIIFLFIIINFNSSFTIFHQIFFPQGNWLFSIDSLLIKTFPINFFIEISSKIFILALLMGMILFFKIRRFK